MATTDFQAMPPPRGQQVAFEWRLDPDIDEKAAKQLADAVQRDGGEAHLLLRPIGVLPVAIPLVIFGVVEVVALAEQVTDWWRNRQRSGILIHVAEDGKVDIRPIDIPYGHVIFVGAGGKTIQYVNVSEDQMKDLLAAASRGIIPPGGSPVQSQGAGGR